jgi:membrane-associated phospholipid phosphatase
MLVRRITAAWVAGAVLLAGAPARAQTVAVDSAGRPPLFEAQDLYWAGGFAVATVALAPLDRAIARGLQNPRVQGNRLLHTGAIGARVLGSPGAVVLSGATYGVGKVVGRRNVAAVGLHTASSVIVADLITGGIKEIAGRRRPYLSPNNPFDFKLFRGTKGDSVRSFPSGHTTSAFAAAAAATTEAGYVWKSGKPYVGVALYGAAGLVGLSRMYNNAHWATDVAVGAGIGSFVGWKLVRYVHTHPNNTLDRVFLGRPPASRNANTPATYRGKWLGEGIPITVSIPGP